MDNYKRGPRASGKAGAAQCRATSWAYPRCSGGFLDRRAFLDALTALGMFGGLRGAAAFAGTVEGRSRLRDDQHLETIGIQLYSVRRELARDFEGTLARIASIGYKEVEFAGYFDRRPKEVRAILDRYRLSAPSAHVPIEVARQDWAGALAAANVVGHRYLVLPWLPPESRRTLDDFKRLAAECNRLGQEAKRAGLRFAYHNHDFEFAPLDGRLPYDVLLAETDPANVALELDLFWITKGGQDPLKYFARYSGRFEMVHVKDSSGPPEHHQVNVGQGTIDFGRILGRRQQAGIRHFFVEHDEPADPLAFARTSFDYLTLELGDS